ncbi:MAG: hypothetical protein LC802_23015 [Acidobacteria bacterium]|nr:hypothetical protein [Acidobacteriota bacterium]
MSEEKRQTRLLPFRLRGKTAAQRAAAGVGPLAEEPADEELRAVLGAWDAPEPSHASRARLIEAFREGARSREPVWKRWLTAHVHLPAPVVACAVVALMACGVMLAARAPRLSLDAPAAVPAPPELKIVEAPAQTERVVTRIVYVERERPADSDTRHERRARAGQLAGRGRAAGASASTDESGTSYFTRVDMGEFQPPDEMKIRVIRKGRTDED